MSRGSNILPKNGGTLLCRMEKGGGPRAQIIAFSQKLCYSNIMQGPVPVRSRARRGAPCDFVNLPETAKGGLFYGSELQ